MDLKDQIKTAVTIRAPRLQRLLAAATTHKEEKERQEGGADAQNETPVWIVGGEEELEEHRS